MKKSPGARAYIAVILAVMYVPIFLVIAYSFNESRISSVWRGFTLGWYRELFRDRSMFEALKNSLVLAALSSLAAAIIGTAGAAGSHRLSRIRASGPLTRPLRLGLAFGRIMEYLSILPLMIPEIILGMVSLVFFSLLALPLGMVTLVIAHTTFCVPYVFLIVKARLSGMDPSLAEAARDLGAPRHRAFLDVTLPLILPGIISGVLLGFAMSFDDVIISVFVTGPRTNTLPIRIYSQIKTGVSPKTNALCSLIFAVTILLGLLSAFFAGREKK